MTSFTWQDGERTIRFGPGVAAEAVDLAGERFTLLTTERARDLIPGIEESAAEVRFVPPGLVDAIATELLPQVTHQRVIALGGGRVIDTAKAIGAVTGAFVGAIPTTLSGAEMTTAHRMPRGTPRGAGPIRPALVVNDPALTASQPPEALAASAANALAHAVESRVTIRTSPVPSLAAEEAARLIDVAFYGDDPAAADRPKLALAALLAGYATDANGIGLHHMLAQTLVRIGGAGHGAANAVLLPETIAALERRVPGHVDPDGTLRQLARKLARFAGAESIGALGVDKALLDDLVEEAAGRPGLDLTPPRAEPEEIRAIYQAAWQ